MYLSMCVADKTRTYVGITNGTKRVQVDGKWQDVVDDNTLWLTMEFAGDTISINMTNAQADKLCSVMGALLTDRDLRRRERNDDAATVEKIDARNCAPPPVDKPVS